MNMDRKDYDRRFHELHPEQSRRAVMLAERKARARQRVALAPFGVKSAQAFVNMWLDGKIEVLKDGKVIEP
jgi:hypothetical protein